MWDAGLVEGERTWMTHSDLTTIKNLRFSPSGGFALSNMGSLPASFEGAFVSDATAAHLHFQEEWIPPVVWPALTHRNTWTTYDEAVAKRKSKTSQTAGLCYKPVLDCSDI